MPVYVLITMPPSRKGKCLELRDHIAGRPNHTEGPGSPLQMGLLCRDMKDVWELTRWKEGVMFQAGGTACAKVQSWNKLSERSGKVTSGELR